jgi:RHS repeat-associated protein
LEFYFYEGMDRVATLDGAGNVTEATLFDGIDHPLRIKHAGGVAYYELDLAGNVRRLRIAGGADLGGYRYTAFGQTKDDTATLLQPLRWKARWHSTLNGAEIYDVRARQWAPELGAFISIDEYWAHGFQGTLWSWPGQNPIRYSDPSGRLDPGTAVAIAAGVVGGASGAAAAVVGAAVIGLLLPPSGPGLPSGGTGPGQGSGGGTAPTPAPDDPGPGAIGPEPPGEGPAGPSIGPLPGGGTGPGVGPGLGPMDSGGGPACSPYRKPAPKPGDCARKALDFIDGCKKARPFAWCLEVGDLIYRRCLEGL